MQMSKKHDDDMIEFRFGIDHERWQQFTQACNIAEGRELSPAEVERKAFNIWCSSIDTVIKYYQADEASCRALILMPWEEKMLVNLSPCSPGDDGDPAIIV
jgi:hypothetical protein